MNAKTPSGQAAKKKPLISTWQIYFGICAFGLLLLTAVVFNKPFGNFTSGVGWKLFIWIGFVSILFLAVSLYRKHKEQA